MWKVQKQQLVAGPPANYDHRRQLSAQSLAIISRRFPQLTDLVTDGTLLAIERPEFYKERRTDGYQQPQLVLLVGTSHVSAVSAQQTERVIRAVRPDRVVVELCRSRAGLLNEEAERKNAYALSGNTLLEAYQRSVSLGGLSALLLRILLGWLSTSVGRSIGSTPGEEFRAAKKAADNIGATIVLGDRPIEITLERCWSVLSLNKRVTLMASLLFGTWQLRFVNEKKIAVAIEESKGDSAVSYALTTLADKHPYLVGPLLHERDRYLAWSMIRSKAVNGAHIVVGIVGKGHMRGVAYAITHNPGDALRFRDLVGPRQSRRAIHFVARTALETLVLYSLWHLFLH